MTLAKTIRENLLRIWRHVASAWYPRQCGRRAAAGQEALSPRQSRRQRAAKAQQRRALRHAGKAERLR